MICAHGRGCKHDGPEHTREAAGAPPQSDKRLHLRSSLSKSLFASHTHTHIHTHMSNWHRRSSMSHDRVYPKIRLRKCGRKGWNE